MIDASNWEARDETGYEFAAPGRPTLNVIIVALEWRRHKWPGASSGRPAGRPIK